MCLSERLFPFPQTSERCTEAPQPDTVLVIEQRDEVFARVAHEIEALGYLVERAADHQQASWKFSDRQFQLVIMNREFSQDERGWHLVCKWSLVRSPRKLWLYTSHSVTRDFEWADFAGVDQVFYYAGNIWSLSEQIVAQLALAAPRLCCLAPSNEITTGVARSKRIWSNVTCRVFVRAGVLAFFAIALGWPGTARHVVIQFESLDCPPCTAMMLEELAAMPGISHSWVNSCENRMVLEIEDLRAISPEKIWDALNHHVCLKADSMSFES